MKFTAQGSIARHCKLTLIGYRSGIFLTSFFTITVLLIAHEGVIRPSETDVQCHMHCRLIDTEVQLNFSIK